MATYSSSSATGAGSMRAVLMLMLLLGAVVAAHGRRVSFENQCGDQPIKVNGVMIPAKATVLIEVGLNVVVTIELADKTGVLALVKYYCPKDVTALVVVYESGCVKVNVKAPGLTFPVVASCRASSSATCYKCSPL